MANKSSIHYIISISILLLIGILAYYPRFKKGDEFSINTGDFPDQINDWIYIEEGKLYESIKQVCFPRSKIDRIYRNDKGEEVELLIGIFVNNDKNNRIHTPKYLFRSYDLKDKGIMQLESENINERINKTSLMKKGTELMMLYCYQVNKKLIHSDFYLKAYSSLISMINNQSKSSFIIIASRPTDVSDPNYEKVKQNKLDAKISFATYSLPIIKKFLK